MLFLFNYTLYAFDNNALSLTTLLLVVLLIHNIDDHALYHWRVRVLDPDELLEIRQPDAVLKDFLSRRKQDVEVNNSKFPATIMDARQNLLVVDVSACVKVKLKENQQHFLIVC